MYYQLCSHFIFIFKTFDLYFKVKFSLLFNY